MTVADRLRSKLTDAFAPVHLEIVDESAMHAGHVGARPEGETHFRIHLVSDAFAGKSRLQRQRAVYDLLADELAGPVHAMSLKIQLTSEYTAEPGT